MAALAPIGWASYIRWLKLRRGRRPHRAKCPCPGHGISRKPGPEISVLRAGGAALFAAPPQ
eukprot:2618602-Alexandrium_andersonii.AAC.1